MTLVISDKAQLDYEESFDWYLKRSLDAAVEFSYLIEQGFQAIANNPTGWRCTEDGFREMVLPTYPFTIVYSILDELDEILITSIHHHKRNPANKYKTK